MTSIEKLKIIIYKLKDERSRWEAILDLKMLNDPSLVEPLIKIMSSNNWVIRWCVAEKLGDLGNSKAITPLIKILRDKDFHVRKNAAKSLEKFGSLAFPALVAHLDERNSNIRKNIHSILVKTGEDDIPNLEAAINTHNWIIANQVIHIIWRIGGEMAEKVLVKAISNKRIQKNAIVMLMQMNSKQGMKELLKAYADPSLRLLILNSFKRKGLDVAGSFLINSLHSSSLPIVLRAEVIIQKIGDPMLGMLVKALSIKGSDKNRIVGLIKKIGPAKALNIIKQLSKTDPQIRHLTRYIRHQSLSKDSDTKGGKSGIFK